MTEDAILTIPEVAALLRISEKSAYKLAQAGDLPAFKVGNQWRFRRAELDAWIDDQRRRPGGPDAERT
ncbi:MAG TPA: helix-turn-helix domain-containing protein [Myxococcota bacterium]|nr:helix-turn-helix domain-containing protein [Myxococcota bacterium]